MPGRRTMTAQKHCEWFNAPSQGECITKTGWSFAGWANTLLEQFYMADA